jgi:ribosomal protein S27AE/ribosomal protein L32
MSDDKKEKSRFHSLLGIDPTLGIGDKVLDHIEEAQEEEKKKLKKSNYYAFCPNCGKKLIRKNLIENGCFVCGWKGKEDEIDLANTKRNSGLSIGLKEVSKKVSYRMNCPNCGSSVVTEEFLRNGCWRCGYKE